MTFDFVDKHCVHCDYCIYSDGEPWGCGEIDDGGCVSTEFRRVSHCRLGYAPIAHKPKYKVGDRIDTIPVGKIIEVVKGLDGYYVIQPEGTHGRFNEPYPVYKCDFEDIDYTYERVRRN